MPVCNSVFDRDSPADCYADLLKLPRVASGRCKVAAVGMRLDARTKADEVLAEWAARLKLPFIGVLRETQGYVRCVERGLTVFDLPAAQVQTDMAQWQPILQWLEPVLHRAPTVRRAETARPAARPVVEASNSRLPVQLARAESAGRVTMATRLGRLLDALAIPRFLQRLT
jgi:chromosome partitioning protein